MEIFAALKDNSIINALFVLALGYIAWSLRKGLTLFEKNQDEHAKLIAKLFEKYEALSCDFHQLLGNHEARHGELNRRKTDQQ